MGPLNLPSHGAVHASEMYSRNVYNMLELIIKEGEIALNPDDEIISGCVLLHDGQIHDEGTAKLLDVECFPLGGVIHRSSEMPDQTSGWLNDESSDEGEENDTTSSIAETDKITSATDSNIVTEPVVTNAVSNIGDTEQRDVGRGSPASTNANSPAGSVAFEGGHPHQ